MSNSKSKATSLMRLVCSQGPERRVPKSWLLRTGSRFDRKFAATASPRFGEFEDYLQAEVNGQLFLWPRHAPRAALLQILSEILTPGHPHQYLFGPTQLDTNDVVLDIGACEGAFSAVATRRCRHVIAIEPSRSMCRLISALFRLRGEPCPEVVNCLLGSEAGSLYFLENDRNPGASRIAPEPVSGAYEVPVRTLDEVAASLEQKPTFIKCDAEGAERAIFSGGKEFLRKFRPKLAITTYHNDGDYASLHRLLTSLGYQVAGKGFLFSGKSLRVQMIHAW
jgi:FkbM family methyltransferase